MPNLIPNKIVLLLFLQAGSIMITLIDTYAGGWNLLLIALFECIAIGYVYGKNA